MPQAMIIVHHTISELTISQLLKLAKYSVNIPFPAKDSGEFDFQILENRCKEIVPDVIIVESNYLLPASEGINLHLLNMITSLEICSHAKIIVVSSTLPSLEKALHHSSRIHIYHPKLSKADLASALKYDANPDIQNRFFDTKTLKQNLAEIAKMKEVDPVAFPNKSSSSMSPPAPLEVFKEILYTFKEKAKKSFQSFSNPTLNQVISAEAAQEANSLKSKSSSSLEKAKPRFFQKN